MGRPIRHAPREIEGFAQRTGYMIGIAPETLADIEIRQEPGLNLFMRREPLGVVLTLAAWNYPYLIPAGSTVPALLAGNAVVLKHSAQTPLCAERLAEAFTAGGLPEGVFQYIHTGHGSIEGAIKSAYVDFVAFTGSVEGGRAVHVAAGPRFIGSALELGGKDPAYVRHDADLEPTIESLVDGNGYNTGQSCCAIERIYVHADVYDRFVEGFTELTKRYRLGNPMDPETTLGPMVRTDAAEFVRKQVSDAVRAGARALIDPSLFPEAKEGTPYLEPQVLVDVDHSMDIMCEETFGPAIGIMKVSSDEEAVGLMNDSRFGLTASIWTTDEAVALEIGERIETGTFFMNRCDYLDPGLAWVGIKDSGCGCGLSRLGFEQLTRPKSFHLRTAF
jgi:acyl-CoA reductase-like NAD-dependent aldehyde dehydrogenase